MKLLALSGSLRAHSANTALLRAVALLASPAHEVLLFDEWDQIPPFNPDHEADRDVGTVAHLRRATQDASAVLISTPEYAHGIPGVLKNALDWMVGSGELAKKPVALLHASSRGDHVRAALKHVLAAMDARLLEDAETTLELMGSGLTAAEIAANAAHAFALTACLRSVASVCPGPVHAEPGLS